MNCNTYNLLKMSICNTVTCYAVSVFYAMRGINLEAEIHYQKFYRQNAARREDCLKCGYR